MNARTCNFDSFDFISLLEAAASYYPERADYSAEYSDFISGNPLLIWDTISSFGMYHTTEYESYLGEEINYIGFPAPYEAAASAIQNRVSIYLAEQG